MLPATFLRCRGNRGYWAAVSIPGLAFTSSTGKVIEEALTLFLDAAYNAFDKFDLLRLKQHQGRVLQVLPVEVHEVATLEVLPVSQQHDCAVVQLLDKRRERTADGAVSGFLGAGMLVRRTHD